MRHSDLALVLVKLKIKSEAYFVLARHEKWKDWSLIGGHLESDERNDWARAAMRECNEELFPLRFGEDFILLPLLDQPIRWGPTQSRSAGNEATIYTAQLFALRFLKEPTDCLARLSRDQFRVVPESEVIGTEAYKEGMLSVASKALGSLDRVSFAWDNPLASSPLKGGAPQF
jgi:hypothetical protein